MSLRFDLRASNDAYLGLSTGNSTIFPGYWIILGGWNNLHSCLRLGFTSRTCLDLHSEPSLKATEYVKFWVLWDSGNIRVGKGEELGNGQILQYVFSNDYVISNVLAAGHADWIFYPWKNCRVLHRLEVDFLYQNKAFVFLINKKHSDETGFYLWDMKLFQ